MSRWIDLDNPKIIKSGRDKFGNVLYAIPPDTPCADVKPVARGNWEMPLEDKDEIYGYVCRCSKCGEAVIGNRYTDRNTPICSYSFCPYCGADMRKKEEKF